MADSPEKILHTLNPYRHTTDIVESSVRLERRRSAQSFGNAEQKIGAYLNRVEDVLGNDALRNRMSDRVIDNALTKHADIPEHYWQYLEKQAREEGLGIIIDDDKAHEIVNSLQNIQREGLENWSSYFEATEEQYPTWFVVHALDNVVRLADFDQEKKTYRRRSNGTVAPFPPLNPEALAYTYGAISGVYGDSSVPVDSTTEQLVKDGNFNKIYSHFMLETKLSLPLPEKQEDVRGEWLYYTPNDVPAIASAAEGTGWCIADQAMATTYTEKEGSFYFFHLQDEETGILSKSAVASIRMVDGNVAEVSGTKGHPHQALEDVLVDEVTDKVFSLEGGAEYYSAMLDKKKIIEMDEKFQDGIPFTIEELRFLYEIDRPIGSLNNYPDVRLNEFRKQSSDHKYQFAQLFGDDAEWMVRDPDDIRAREFDELLENGASVSALIHRVGRKYYLGDKVPDLLSRGADPTVLVDNLMDRAIIDNLSELNAAGALFDSERIFQVAGENTYTLRRVAKSLIEIGIDSGRIAEKFDAKHIERDFRHLIESGIHPDHVTQSLAPGIILTNLRMLLVAGSTIDLNELAAKLKPSQVASQLAVFIKYGATIDTHELMKQLPAETILKYLKQFQQAGVEVDTLELIKKVKPKRLKAQRGWLLAAGVDPKYL